MDSQVTGVFDVFQALHSLARLLGGLAASLAQLAPTN